MFLETVRAESLIPMPPQMEDAIFGMNSNFYIKEVSNEKKREAQKTEVFCFFVFGQIQLVSFSFNK